LYLDVACPAASLIARLVESGLHDVSTGLVVWVRLVDDWTVAYADNGAGLSGAPVGRDRMTELEFLVSEVPGGGANMSHPFIESLAVVSALSVSCRTTTSGKDGTWTIHTAAGRVTEPSSPCPDITGHGTTIRFTIDQDVVQAPIPSLHVVAAAIRDASAESLRRSGQTVFLTDEREHRSILVSAAG
jgi:hypothetical protein